MQKKVKLTLEKFIKNPKDKVLKNHKLSGRMSDMRVISVTGDLRIIFQEFEDYTLVIMLDIGSHNQVY